MDDKLSINLLDRGIKMFFGKKHRVLVVDDDEDMLSLLKKILSDRKYNVVQAANGKECIEKAKEFSPDIIIMDVMMPELDGIATILKLRSHENTRSIPIIMCTAVTESEDEILARNLGAVDYVRKTPQMDELISKLDRFLNQ